MRSEKRVSAQELGESRYGERRFGRYVESGRGEAMRCRKLSREKKGQEELRFTCAAEIVF